MSAPDFDVDIPDVELKIISHPNGDADIDGLTATATLGFPTISPFIPHVDINLRNGKWYYEVRLLTSGVMQIGWAVYGDFYPNGTTGGVGDDDDSYAIDLSRNKLFSGTGIDFPGPKWRVGSTIGCGVDLDNRLMSFYLDGQQIGWNVDISERLAQEDGMYPCVSLFTGDKPQKATLVFDQQFMKYLPPTYNAIPQGLALLASPLARAPTFDFSSRDQLMEEKQEVKKQEIDIKHDYYAGSNNLTVEMVKLQRAAARVVPEITEEGREQFVNLQRLVHASHVRDIKAVKRIVQEDKTLVNNVDKQNIYYALNGQDSDLTPLHWATRRGCKEVAAYLIKEGGAHINAQTQLGRTPVMVAIENDFYEVMEFLISQGADLTLADRMGRTALFYAVDPLRSQHHSLSKAERRPYVMKALHKRTTIVKQLLATKKLEVNATDAYGMTALMHAVHNGYVDIAKALINAGADVNFVNQGGWNALLYAEMPTVVLHAGVRQGSKKYKRRCVSLLRKKGADPKLSLDWAKQLRAIAYGLYSKNTQLVKLLVDRCGETFLEARMKDSLNDSQQRRDGDYETPLLLASKAGSLPIVEWLIGKGANASATNKHGMSAYLVAVHENHIDIVKYFLQNGITGVDSALPDGRTAVMIAAAAGHAELVALLVDEFSADISCADKARGQTPIFHAVRGGDVNILKLLLERNCNVEARDDQEKTALILAATVSFEMVRLLVSAGANIDARDQAGVTPLFAAGRELIALQYELDRVKDGRRRDELLMLQPEFVRIMKFLLRNQARIIPTKFMGTIVSVAVKLADTSILQQTLGQARPEIINLANKDGRTPLMDAVRADNLKAASALVQAEADTKLLTEDDDTLLHMVKSVGMCRFLAKRCKLDVNQTNKLGRTPLMEAVVNGNLEVVKYLVTSGGADVEKPNKRGETALIIAAARKQFNIVEWLVTEGHADPNTANRDGDNTFTILMNTLGYGELRDKQSGNLLTADVVTAVVSRVQHYPNSYEKSSIEWIFRALQDRNFEVAACLYGCRFTHTTASKQHVRILRTIDFQHLSVQSFFEDCKRGVLTSPSPVLGSLRMARIFKLMGRINPAINLEFQEGKEKFRKLSFHLWRTLQCNDFVASLILEQQTSDLGKEDETLIDLALRSDNTNFMRSARLDRIVAWWWESPQFTPQMLRSPHKLFRAARVKFWLDVTSFISFLFLFSALLTQSVQVDSDITNLEWVLLVFGVGYLFHEVLQMVSDGWRRYSEDGWNLFDMVICVFVLLVIICRGPNWSDGGDTVEVVYKITMSTGALIMWARSLFLLTLSPTVGPLLLTLRRMILDIFNFSVLFLVFLLGAFFAFTFIVDYDECNASLSPPNGCISAPYGTSRGLVIFLFQRGLAGEPMSDFDELTETNEWIAEILGSVFLLITAVVLVNLLIAMMSNSYSKVKEASDYEFLFSRIQTRWRYDQSRNELPPPFNLLALVAFSGLWVLSQAYFLVRGVVEDRKQEFCGYCHRNLNTITAKFSDNYFHRRMYDGSEVSKGDPFYLDYMIDIKEFTNADINYAHLRDLRQKHDRYVEREEKELSDEELKMILSPYRSEIQGFSQYGGFQGLCLHYADKLVEKGDMCICGRLRSPISTSRYTLERINTWVFTATIWFPFIWLPLTLSSIQKYFPFGRSSEAKPMLTNKSRQRTSILSADDSGKELRLLAHDFFKEWSQPFWQRVFRVTEVDVPVQPYLLSDPLYSSKKVLLPPETKSTNERIDALHDDVEKLPSIIRAMQKQLSELVLRQEQQQEVVMRFKDMFLSVNDMDEEKFLQRLRTETLEKDRKSLLSEREVVVRTVAENDFEARDDMMEIDLDLSDGDDSDAELDAPVSPMKGQPPQVFDFDIQRIISAEAAVPEKFE